MGQKKVVAIFVVMCLAAAFLALRASQLHGIGAVPAERVELLVVETRENISSSRIILYDKGLREIGSVSLPYASLGYLPGVLTLSGESVHIVPGGLMGRRDEKKVLEIDSKDLSVDTYPIERVNLYDSDGNDRFAFAISNLNQSSFVSRYDSLTGEVEEEELVGAYATSLRLAGDSLLVFYSDLKNPQTSSYLNVYDIDLNLMSTIEISGLGSSQYRSRVMGDDVLFVSESDSTGQKLGSSYLGIWRSVNNEVESICLKKPILDVIPYRDAIIVLYGLENDNEYERTTKAVLIDESTYERLGEEVDLGCAVRHCCEKDGSLFVVDSDRQLRRYSIRDGFSLEAAQEISKMDNSYSYISGICSV